MSSKIQLAARAGLVLVSCQHTPERAKLTFTDQTEAVQPRSIYRNSVLPKSRFAYVSFRTDQGTYSTKNRARLPKGELVLTDGGNTVRARYGNNGSDQAQQPTAAVLPTVANDRANRLLAEQSVLMLDPVISRLPSISSPLLPEQDQTQEEGGSVAVMPIMSGGGGGFLLPRSPAAGNKPAIPDDPTTLPPASITGAAPEDPKGSPPTQPGPTDPAPGAGSTTPPSPPVPGTNPPGGAPPGTPTNPLITNPIEEEPGTPLPPPTLQLPDDPGDTNSPPPDTLVPPHTRLPAPVPEPSSRLMLLLSAAALTVVAVVCRNADGGR